MTEQKKYIARDNTVFIRKENTSEFEEQDLMFWLGIRLE
jgi:hypothetical protein